MRELNQDSILSDTVLKKYSKCGHPRGNHPNDGKCEVKNCVCKYFVEQYEYQLINERECEKI